MSENKERMLVPQMIGLEKLTKIIVAYLKAGADDQEISYNYVSNLSNVSIGNVRRNTPFFEYIGLLEGTRGKFKLTDAGKAYAQALDWGRIKDANKTLRKKIRDNDLIKRIRGYVSINRPVEKDNLVSKIANIVGVVKSSRYKTGINGLVDMLVSSNLLKEDNKGYLIPAKFPIIKEEIVIQPLEEKIEIPKINVPISIKINLDGNNITKESLKKLLKDIKESLAETT